VQEEENISVSYISEVLRLQHVLVFTGGISVTNLNLENVSVNEFFNFVTQSKTVLFSAAPVGFFGFLKPRMQYSRYFYFPLK
jgi:hypothetical protein